MDINKINGNELHGSKRGKGWEKCSDPITNDYVWTDRAVKRLLRVMISGEMETCPACHGNQNMVLGTLGKNTYTRCRDCGMNFVNRETLNVE